jgi:teichuronic acid biosynthesis glycosyltransferase TuaG
MSTPGERPMLSVIVPLYQSVATVGETVRSALADDVEGGIEVVVVDDGSTDGGPRMVGEVMRRDGRVRMVHRSNGGLAAARNTGIANARGIWLRFLDADDVAVAGSAGRLIGHATAHGLRAACAAHELIDERGEPMGRTCPAQSGADGTIGLDEFLESNRCGVGTVVIRGDAIGATRFDKSLRVCEDWDLWARLSTEGLRIGVRPGPAAKLYRVRRASLSKDFGAMLRVGQGVLAAAFRRARERGVPGVDLSAARERRGMARMALEWATMRALGDAENRVTDAAEMFRFAGGAPFDADAAAGAAHWGALLGLGVRPEAPSVERDTWLRRVRAWWACCAEHGWLAEGEIEKAWSVLAELAAGPLEIARACVWAAKTEGVEEVVIIGAGANGRLVARMASEVGLRVVFRDDRLDSGELGAEDLPEGARAERMDAAIPGGSAVIVAAANDEAIVGRLEERGAVRWRVVRQALARTLEKELRSDSIDLRLGRRGRTAAPR